MKSTWNLEATGTIGKWVSDLRAAHRLIVDDLAFVHSMISKSNVHGPAPSCKNGLVLPGFPAWALDLLSALGSMSENLPTFVILPDPRGFAPNGPATGPRFSCGLASRHDDPGRDTQSYL